MTSTPTLISSYLLTDEYIDGEWGNYKLSNLLLSSTLVTRGCINDKADLKSALSSLSIIMLTQYYLLTH